MIVVGKVLIHCDEDIGNERHIRSIRDVIGTDKMYCIIELFVLDVAEL